ncbi:MAG: hypothetical protein GTO40_27840 [Deltaproteobacteria bacterium]|nr:hypothetical protein [Deltaproteobacteria bacterium]
MKGTFLIPFLLLLIYLGGFAVKNSFGDMVLVLLFGALGWLMVRYNWQRPPLLLGLVLGGIAENNLFISTRIYGANWLARPGVIMITILILGALFYPMYQAYREKLRREEAGGAMAPEEPAEEAKENSKGRSNLPHVMFSLFVVIVFAYVVREAFFGFGATDERPALFPMMIGIPGLILALVVLGKEFMSPSAVIGGEMPVGVEPAEINRRLISIIGWVLGFFLSIWLLGFVITSALASFLYLKFGAKENWLISIILTLVAWGFFYGVFDFALHLPFPPGELLVWLGLD